MAINQHVVSRGDNWAVHEEGKEKATAIFVTQEQAIKIARQKAIENKSILIIHGRDGKIRQRHDYSKSTV